MKSKIRSYSHAVGEFNYHIQLTPAYRRNVFVNEQTLKLAKAYIVAKAEVLKIEIFSIGFGPNHVHIFVVNCKNYAPCKMVQFFKGFSSRMMRKNHWALFRGDLWGKKFWSEGYFCRTVGSVTAETVRHYIEESQQKHWN